MSTEKYPNTPIPQYPNTPRCGIWPLMGLCARANRFLRAWVVGSLGIGVFLTSAFAGSRVKDLTMVAGARDNQLVGYGLVTGIAGDGDKNPVYTLQSIANFLQRFGVNVPAATLSSKNVAAVMVTARSEEHTSEVQ